MALDFAAGCVGGIAGVLAGHPLDTVKVRLQTQDIRNPIYRGTWHTFTTILRTESVRGLYKGVTSPMGGVAFINAVLFGLYGNIQRAVAKDEDDITSHIAAGAIAGFAQSFISGPMEMAKIRLQVQKTQVYRSALDCLMKSAKDGGIKEVYRGMSLTVMREVPSFSAYFFTYEALMKFGGGSTAEMLFAGGMAGVVSWFITYPIDVIKTRVQSDGIRGEKLKYKGTLDCVRCAVAQEGYRFLFRGLNSTLIRAFPTNGVTFTVVTWIFKLSERLKQTSPTMPEPPHGPEESCLQSHSSLDHSSEGGHHSHSSFDHSTESSHHNHSTFDHSTERSHHSRSSIGHSASHSQRHGKALHVHVHDHDRIHLHNADFSFYSII